MATEHSASKQQHPDALYDTLRGAIIGYHILGEITYSSSGASRVSGARDLFDKQKPPAALDPNTQLTIGSIQKSFAAACSLLKLWDTELTQAQGKQSEPGERKESDPPQATTSSVKWFPDGLETPVSHYMVALRERFGNKALGKRGCDSFFASVEQDISKVEDASRTPEGYPTETITLRDLLNHTHGFGTEDPAKYAMLYNGNQPIELYDMVNTFSKGKDAYGKDADGKTRNHYGNVSIALASMIAEIAGSDISGKRLTFEDVVDQYVRKPCGLENHTSLSRDTQDQFTKADTNVARGIWIDPTTQEEVDGNVERYVGGVKASAQGLVIYARQYITGEMFTNPQVKETVVGRKNALDGHVTDKDGKDTGVTYHLGIGANSKTPNTFQLLAGGACSQTSLTFDKETNEVDITLRVLHGFSDHVARSIFAEKYPDQKAALDKLWQTLGETNPDATGSRVTPQYYGDVDRCLMEDPQGLAALKLYQSIYDKVQAAYTPEQLKTKSEPDDSQHNRNAQSPAELMQEIRAKVIASPHLPKPTIAQKSALEAKVKEEKSGPAASASVASAAGAAPDVGRTVKAEVNSVTAAAEEQMRSAPSEQHRIDTTQHSL